ncbi:MAG: CHAT domain-containing protein [Candidatus Aminicenantes bacterium]|jgi:hypothetical protein
MRKKILILAANPKTTTWLSLDEEVREIEICLERAKQREKFDIKSIWAVRFRDLRKALLDYKPQIVHFSGHGEEDGLILGNELGIGVTIPSKALSLLFSLCSRHVECVILNACYSATQADAIKQHINYVIGAPGKINDRAAIEFSVGFYDALGAGETVEDAFKFGITGIYQILPDLPENLIPFLGKRTGRMETGTQTPPSPLEKLLKEGMESLDLEDYNLALEKFQKARELEPGNEKAQFFYCLSFLSGKPLHSIKKSDMNEIYKILKKIVHGKDRELANLARIVLCIVWYDYYLKEDDQYQELFFKENMRYLMNYQPSFEEKQLVSHIVCSDSAKTLSRLR